MTLLVNVASFIGPPKTRITVMMVRFVQAMMRPSLFLFSRTRRRMLSNSRLRLPRGVKGLSNTAHEGSSTPLCPFNLTAGTELASGEKQAKTMVSHLHRQSMPRTRHQAKQLRGRQDEVEDLGKEEQQQGLGKMTKDADHRKSHAGEVAECIADESLGRKPEVFRVFIISQRPQLSWPGIAKA